MPKKRWNEDKVIAELRRHRQGGPRMHPQLDAAARRYFGSVRRALEVAGLPCGKRPPPYLEWSREAVITAIRQRCRAGKGLDSTNREDRPLYSAAKRLFGNWSAARAAAGFPRAQREFYTADEVRLRIIELYEQELPLTLSPQNDLKLRRSVKTHFGGWRRAVESLGLGSELRRVWTDQAVVDAIHHRRAVGLSLYMTHHEDKGLFSAAVSRFGSWPNALKAAGIDARVRERWSKEKVIQRLREISETAPGQNIRHLDSNLAAAAARRFGSLTRALDAAGVKSKYKKPR